MMIRFSTIVAFLAGHGSQALSPRRPDGDVFSPVREMLRGSPGHPPPEAFCTFGPRPGFNDTVQVFISGGNVRSLAFGSDREGAQSRLRCRGRVSQKCLDNRASANGRPPRCEDLPGCGCAPDVATLRFEVHRAMVDEVVPRCTGKQAIAGFRVLLIGLGGAALPEYVLSRCGEGTRFESVEYDPRVIEAAEAFFGFSISEGRSEVERGDGGCAVRERAQQGDRYDVVMVDAFAPGGSVPASVSNSVFASNVLSILKPGGQLVQHILTADLQENPLLKRYQQVFGVSAVREIWSTNYGAGSGVSRVVVAAKAATRNESVS